MNELRISAASSFGVTVISNRFLDEYMPRANGEFVKIYLYLLRLSSGSCGPVTPGTIADRLHYTETDVFRALRYWEKEGLLSLSFDEEGELLGIVLAFPGMAVSDSRELSDAPAHSAGDSSFSKNAPDGPAFPEETPDTVLAAAPASAAEPLRPLPSQLRVSAKRKAELKGDEEVRELLYIVERYLNKTLSETEVNAVLYFYDELHFTADLIDYLFEYCVSKEHTGIQYIKKVAFAWYKEGITTRCEAKSQVQAYHKEYYDILKAIGITNREPVSEEITLMDKWLRTFCLPMEIIEAACTRTVMNSKRPSLRYTDTILTSWHAEEVKTLEDIRRLDAAYEKSQRDNRSAARRASSSNRFNRFDQHDYDFTDIEKRLLTEGGEV